MVNFVANKILEANPAVINLASLRIEPFTHFSFTKLVTKHALIVGGGTHRLLTGETNGPGCKYFTRWHSIDHTDRAFAI